MEEEEKISTKINFGSKSFKKYFANTSWLLAIKIIKLIISFVVNIYIIRYLGPNEFGLLSYAISFVGLFAAFSSLGLDNILVRELVRAPEKKDYLLGSAFLLKFSGSFLSLAVIGIVLLIISETSFNVILIFIVSASTIFQTLNVIDFYFQSKVEVKFSAYAQFFGLVLSSSIKIALILLSAPLLYFAIITSLEFAFISIGFVAAYHKRGERIIKWRFNKKIALNMLNDSWPLILSGLMVAVYMKIDQVLIKKMLGDVEVGYYAAAVRISEAWYFIPTAICTSLFPAIINAKNNNALYISRFQKLYDILVWLSIAIAVPLTLFSGVFIHFLLGSQYAPSATVLTIYIWAGIPVFLGVASGQFLVNENFTKIAFYRTFAGMFINVILNLVLIPVWGINGSAWATLISYSIATFSIGFSKRSRTQFKLMLRSVLLINLPKIIIQRLKF